MYLKNKVIFKQLYNMRSISSSRRINYNEYLLQAPQKYNTQISLTQQKVNPFQMLSRTVRVTE